ncbi:MAG TPA: hypothetical protein VJV78_03695, partial [Polyangiales bacterium]|nr:hypothetical protein [Polyangiales bacterium]
GDGAAGAGSDIASAGGGAAGASDEGDSGLAAGSGASAAGSGGDVSDAGMQQPRPPAVPVLPPLRGECPTFMSGKTTVMIDGVSVVLDVGPKSARTGSLLFYWHGTGSSAEELNNMLSRTVLDDLLAKGGVIAALEKSTRRGENTSGTGEFSAGDLEIADQIVACAVRDHAIDPARIYTTGCSAGGFQSGSMALLRAGYVAAAVTNSGGLALPPLPKQARLPAVMTIYGLSPLELIDLRQMSHALSDLVTAASGFAIDCDTGSSVCRTSPELQSAGWQFLQDHPYGVEPEPYAMQLPSIFPSYCRVHR